MISTLTHHDSRKEAEASSLSSGVVLNPKASLDAFEDLDGSKGYWMNFKFECRDRGLSMYRKTFPFLTMRSEQLRHLMPEFRVPNPSRRHAASQILSDDSEDEQITLSIENHPNLPHSSPRISDQTPPSIRSEEPLSFGSQSPESIKQSTPRSSRSNELPLSLGKSSCHSHNNAGKRKPSLIVNSLDGYNSPGLVEKQPLQKRPRPAKYVSKPRVAPSCQSLTTNR